MHPVETRAEVLRLIAGLNDCEISRELGVPRTTVRDMRKPRPRVERPACPRCWAPMREMRFTPGEYAELLGFYLGDGHISRVGRSHRLRISLDAAHSAVIDDVTRLMRRCFVENRVGVMRADRGATVIPFVYSSHLPCLFPQHGPGQKHTRRMALEPWQQRLVDDAPWAFIRGCIHSDGCFFTNRTGPYSYLSAEFSNRSDDIRAMFMRACDRVGLQYRVNRRAIRFYRRETIARLTMFVGAKW